MPPAGRLPRESAAGPNRKGFPLLPYPVVACSAVFFWSISLRALIYTVMPTVATDLRLSSSMAGMVIAAMLLGYSAGSWLAGWLPGSRKARILAAVLLSLPGAVLVSLARDVGILLGGALLTGLGTGMYLPLGLSLIVDVGGESRKARYMMPHEAAATMASFGGSAFVAVSLAWIDWHGAILAWCAVAVIALAIFARVRDDKGEVRARGATGPLRPTRTLLYGFIPYAATLTLLAGLISVLPLILVRSWGLDQAQAATVVGYTRLGGLVGAGAAGLVGDRWGHGRMLLGFQLLSLFGGVAMAVDGYGALFVVGLLVMAVGASGTILILPITIAAAAPVGQKEQTLAVTTAVGSFVGMVLAPALFGVLVDAGLPTGPIVLTVTGTFAGIFATRRIRPTGKRNVG